MTYTSLDSEVLLPNELLEEPSEISPAHKIISACAGAILTSILTTPLDLVKTRLQSQTAYPSNSSGDYHSGYSPASYSKHHPLSRFSPSTLLTTASHSSPSVSGASSSTIELCFCTPPGRRTATLVYQQRQYPFCFYPSSLEYPAQAGHGPTTWAPSSGHSNTTIIEPSTRAAANYSSRHITGTWDGFVKIFRHEGFTSLWRGLSPTLLMSVPTTVVYFVGYDHLRGYMGKRLRNSPELDFYTPFVAGGIARAVSATLISPLELVRTRMQSSASHSLPVVLRGLVDMAKTMGFSSLWRGLSPTLWRDIPFSSIYWTSYEVLKGRLIENSRRSRPHHGGRGTGTGAGTTSALHATDLSSSENFRISFISGALSGMLAATLTIPFDVAKTRRQVDMARRPVPTSFFTPKVTHALPSLLSSSSSSSLRTSAHRSEPRASQSESTIRLMRRIVDQEGIPGLYRGLSARLIKVAPACAIMISSYEYGKRLFGDAA
ncbi:Carrier protein, mitochondrial [Dimargaris cristalligena]|nr:Carrier protein, mitochondrial [Dimargaris cristalligena]